MAEEKQFNKPEIFPKPEQVEASPNPERQNTEQGQPKPEQKAQEQPFEAQQPQQDLETKKEAERLREQEYEGRQIEQLLIMAQEKGEKFAQKVAKELAQDDPLLMDRFHDKLVENNLISE